MSDLIIPGKMEFKCKIDDRGHFEKGRWVTLFTPLLDYLVDHMNIDEPKFEMEVIEEIPIFHQGVCTRYRIERRSLGIFTQRELMEIIEVRQ